MNIYARYFNQDILVHNLDELINFLSSIPEIPVNQRLIDDVRNYLESPLPYPRHYKIRPRVYFILIKTTAETMEDFKANRKNQEEVDNTVSEQQDGADKPLKPKEIKDAMLAEEHEGWYLCSILFKRVIQNATTSKCSQQDTKFVAYIHAHSGQECYERIVAHLKNRAEIDSRSQYPSARGSNFTYEYVSEEMPVKK